jgi:uncharacterized protein YbjQ (UPF0145 family)
VTPLFRRRDPGSAADREAAAAREADSLARLADGHIPTAAAERLQAQRASQGGAFSSDLSVAEFALLARLGISPLTLVMGSSIYQVGWQWGAYNVPTEIVPLSRAYNESRRLALARLLEEAQLAGADAVVGVRITEGAHDWAAGAVEFVAFGTAVRLPDALRHPGGPVLTDLSGQDYVKLCNAGVRPVGVAGRTSVHYVPASWSTQRALGGGGLFGSNWANQELTDFTQGVYDAREKAVSALVSDARALGGDGVIGVSIREQTRGNRVNRGGYESMDLIITFSAIGTVVADDPSLAGAADPPRTVVSLGRAAQKGALR